MSGFIVTTGSAGVEVLGGKGASLARASEAGLRVPEWFVVAPAAFEASLCAEQRAELRDASAADPIGSTLAALAPSAKVAAAIADAVARVCPADGFVAVRSSAVDEDGAESSFAGQLDSYLFVRPADVAARVADVWRSAFAERVFAYRRERSLDGPPQAPAVIVQAMLDPEAAGVAFSADPVSGDRDVCVVSAVRGLGSALVSGDADADAFRVNASGVIVERLVARKSVMHRPAPHAPGGVEEIAVPEHLAGAPALADDDIRRVASLARSAEECFGTPQDIEWALCDGELWLLQSRPITSLASAVDDDGAVCLWDDSNIAESYAGVTTPLTFSFARRAYEGVYREFSRLMGVSEETIAANDRAFRRMLGLVHGRVYYNMASWYRLLATLPGFASNRRFMEQMMGARDGIPDELLGGDAQRSGGLRDRLALARTLAGLVRAHVGLERLIQRFYARLDDALAPRPLAEMRADELAAYYTELERKLLTHWDAPLVNDFFAMVYFGLLGSLCERWCGDADGTLQNALVAGEGGMVSTEPPRRVREMAELAAADAELVRLLSEAPADEAQAALRTRAALAAAYERYLQDFGDRCLEELKLESPTLHDDPSPLLRAIGGTAARIAEGDSARAPETDPRADAEREARASLAGHPLRRAVFAWVLPRARGRVRDRENLRFERTRVFGRVRRILLEIGRRFAERGALDDARDVFYLEVEEVLGFVDGTGTTTDLKGLVAVRRAEFERHAVSAAPPSRFETRGVVGLAQPRASAPAAVVPDGDSLRGVGSSPGVARGRLRVVRDPRAARIRQGEILVAERTDPGWVMLFPAAAGVLVERGSLLSHSAIVARELGIPAVVSIPGLMEWARDGDVVELDGATGVVRRLASAEAGAASA